MLLPLHLNLTDSPVGQPTRGEWQVFSTTYRWRGPVEPDYVDDKDNVSTGNVRLLWRGPIEPQTDISIIRGGSSHAGPDERKIARRRQLQEDEELIIVLTAFMETEL